VADFFKYNFGYSWPWSYGHLVAAGIFGLIGVLAVVVAARKWAVVAGIATLWAIAAFVTFDAGLHRPAGLPTPRFLESGRGRVLDGGAGSGRATVMVLLARPQARVVALDLFQEGYGISANNPDRLRANARAAGAEDRLEIREGDLRNLPFESGSFDAALSSFAIDHLGRNGSQQAVNEMARVLRPGGQFLLMVLNTDAYVRFAYPVIHLHMYYGQGGSRERWRTALTTAGFAVVEQGTRPATMYFLAEKPRNSSGHSDRTNELRRTLS
jgi:SAM-dependent methyltransferase